MNKPFISCICPTYKRPELLKNSIACFLAQKYPSDYRELVILDDAGQFDASKIGNVEVISTNKRYENLPDKFNDLVNQTQGEVIAVWEDDDIFLPNHLSEIATAHSERSGEYYVSKNVWSTYQQEQGGVQLENAAGRFHSSWRFTRRLFDEIGGYPKTGELAFDQIFGESMRQAGNGSVFYGEPDNPSYVYRWGNGYWHGSQRGAEGFQSLWDYLESLPAEPCGVAAPVFDKETEMIMARLGYPTPDL